VFDGRGLAGARDTGGDDRAAAVVVDTGLLGQVGVDDRVPDAAAARIGGEEPEARAVTGRVEYPAGHTPLVENRMGCEAGWVHSRRLAARCDAVASNSR